MTAASLTHLPLQVGGVLLVSAGKTALWIVARYMRAPLANTAIAALVTLTAVAASNAAFLQKHSHPAPLFAPFTQAGATVEPVVPASRSERPLAQTTPTRTAPAQVQAAQESSGPIGNKDVFELQRKLESLRFFTGTVDGYYGPQTARAIKAYEEAVGLKPVGQLTPQVLEHIRNAPLSLTTQPRAATPAPQPQAEPAPVQQRLQLQPAAAPAKAPVQPQTLAQIRPLAAPQPLALAASDPEDDASETAGDAIDNIVAGVQQVAMSPRSDVGTDPIQTATITPQPGVPLKIVDEAPKPGEAIKVLDTAATPEELKPFSVTDPASIAKVQRALASLGFLHGPADGVAGEATAKAIRNFEVYFNYNVTGRITPELLDLLTDKGASI